MDDRPCEPSKKVVARYFDMWNTGDTSMIDQILSHDWVAHAHARISGPDGVRDAIQRVRSATPDFRFDIEDILGDGDLVTVIGTIGRGAEAASPPSPLIWLIRLKDGRMTEVRTYHENQASR